MNKDKSKARNSRRDFLKNSAVVVGASIAARLGEIPAVHAAGSAEIRVGLVGCGGRGSGAADQVLRAAPGVKLIALGDAFADRLEPCHARFVEKFKDQVDVPKDRCFVGFDAYEKVIACDINYVILASPPGFRPAHLKAAVGAGKHIFTEKPVAVDGPGIRTCLALYDEAQRKGLHIAAGTQRRHQNSYLEAMKLIHDGAIGQIVAARAYWNQGPLWTKARQPEWSDMEWQLRNWLYFTWLSGDHIVEQHVHNLDVVNWAMQAHPVRAVGMGGRQVRTAPEYGHIFDHFAIDYEYENGAHMMSMCRQIEGCENSVSEALIGTKGNADLADRRRYSVRGEKPWQFAGKEVDSYLQEHTDLIESIRAAKPLNELKNVTESTLTAIMGRMSAYTGKAVTWDQALNSSEDLMPTQLTWGKLPVPPVPTPGQTQLA
ncbi:MAG TPA: Gfo/Idh/MocA family oxidoreductase [Terriglobia bacterium]|nr:Gfo/Idh/MocA family oxidoreductase [Terriglobia bacterium]